MPDAPFARLPDEVTFRRDELARILFALDLGIDAAVPGSGSYQQLRSGQRLVTSKLWPELGDVLEGDGDHDAE